MRAPESTQVPPDPHHIAWIGIVCPGSVGTLAPDAFVQGAACLTGRMDEARQQLFHHSGGRGASFAGPLDQALRRPSSLVVFGLVLREGRIVSLLELRMWLATRTFFRKISTVLALTRVSTLCLISLWWTL